MPEPTRLNTNSLLVRTLSEAPFQPLPDGSTVTLVHEHDDGYACYDITGPLARVANDLNRAAGNHG